MYDGQYLSVEINLLYSVRFRISYRLRLSVCLALSRSQRWSGLDGYDMVRRAILITATVVLALLVVAIIGWVTSKQDREKAQACEAFFEATKDARSGGGVQVTPEVSRQLKRCAEYLSTHQSGHP